MAESAEQFGDGHAQPVRDLEEYVEGRISTTYFDGCQVGPMQVGPLGEILLSPAALGTQLPDPIPESTAVCVLLEPAGSGHAMTIPTFRPRVRTR